MSTFWGILFLLFLFIELVTVNLVTIWFAVGSLITLFVTLFWDCSFFVQGIIFILTSLASLIATKPLIRKFKVVNFEPTNMDRYIGKKGEVIKKITSKERGEVKVLGTIWTAVSEETLEVGDEIEVLKIDGVKLIVKKEEN